MRDFVVQDEEILYRRILADRGHYTVRDDGVIEIHSIAFGDRGFRISVDRAVLCGNNPKYTLRDETDGVVSLLTADVRSIDTVARNDKQGRAIQQFSVDVEPAPLEDNPAHAEICAIPLFTPADKAAFRRLC